MKPILRLVLSWDGEPHLYVFRSTFKISGNIDKMVNVIIFLKIKSGGGLSSRLRYAEVTMVENDPICLPYSQEEFNISSMMCATSLTSKNEMNKKKLFIIVN